MNKGYAKDKLSLLLRDIDNFNDGELWRELSRIAYGSTIGQPNAEDLVKQFAESTVYSKSLERENARLKSLLIANEGGSDKVVEHNKALTRLIADARQKLILRVLPSPGCNAVLSILDSHHQYASEHPVLAPEVDAMLGAELESSESAVLS